MMLIRMILIRMILISIVLIRTIPGPGLCGQALVYMSISVVGGEGFRLLNGLLQAGDRKDDMIYSCLMNLCLVGLLV